MKHDGAVMLYTIGHGSHALPAFCAALAHAGIAQVLDVRRFPMSRRNPQYDLGPLRHALALHHVGYVHMPALGGRRSELAAPRHANAGIDDAGLRAFADYTQTSAFTLAFAELLDRARAVPSVLMCAEGHPNHCHRRILTDHAIHAGLAVTHLVVGGESIPGAQDPLVRIADDGTLHYPARQRGLFD